MQKSSRQAFVKSVDVKTLQQDDDPLKKMQIWRLTTSPRDVLRSLKNERTSPELFNVCLSEKHISEHTKFGMALLKMVRPQEKAVLFHGLKEEFSQLR